MCPVFDDADVCKGSNPPREGKYELMTLRHTFVEWSGKFRNVHGFQNTFGTFRSCPESI